MSLWNLQIESKLASLSELNHSTPKEAIGWRPSGDPRLDTYPLRRPVYLEHIEKLREMKEKLAREVEV